MIGTSREQPVGPRQNCCGLSGIEVFIPSVPYRNRSSIGKRVLISTSLLATIISFLAPTGKDSSCLELSRFTNSNLICEEAKAEFAQMKIESKPRIKSFG